MSPACHLRQLIATLPEKELLRRLRRCDEEVLFEVWKEFGIRDCAYVTHPSSPCPWAQQRQRCKHAMTGVLSVVPVSWAVEFGIRLWVLAVLDSHCTCQGKLEDQLLLPDSCHALLFDRLTWLTVDAEDADLDWPATIPCSGMVREQQTSGNGHHKHTGRIVPAARIVARLPGGRTVETLRGPGGYTATVELPPCTPAPPIRTRPVSEILGLPPWLLSLRRRRKRAASS